MEDETRQPGGGWEWLERGEGVWGVVLVSHGGGGMSGGSRSISRPDAKGWFLASWARHGAQRIFLVNEANKH